MVVGRKRVLVVEDERTIDQAGATPTVDGHATRPLARLRSIEAGPGVPVAVLVAVPVAVAAVLATAGGGVGLPPALTIPAAVAAGLLVTQVLARGMTAPLRELTAAARAMAAGDHTRRVTATARNEVGELARAVNTMAADLEAVDRQRRDLVASVSQELRPPVAALRGLLENLADGVVRPDPAQLQTALEQTERLGALVSGLLDLSRLEAGLTALEPQSVAVRPFLKDAVREAGRAGRPVRYELVVEPFDLVVHADRARLHQLVANLLDDAGRHSPPRGTVRVHAMRAEGGLLLDVCDDGPGIAPAQRATASDRSSTGGTGRPDGGTGRPDGGAGRADGGAGLGLAIARWVTDLHGGSIEVVETAAGCRIRARLPQASPR